MLLLLYVYFNPNLNPTLSDQTLDYAQMAGW